jgi:hypothetical protein
MAVITRVNGVDCQAGVLYGLNAKFMFITVKDTDEEIIDLRDEDDLLDGVVEQIVKEINPMAFLVEDTDNGEIVMVVDKSVSSDDLRHRIRLIGSTEGWNRETDEYSITEIGPNEIDISGTVVSEGVGYSISIEAD